MENRCSENFLNDIIRVYPLQLQHQLPPTVRTDVVAYSQLGEFDEDRFREYIATKPHFTTTDGTGESDAVLLQGNVQLRDATEKTRGGYQHTISCSVHTLYNGEGERALVAKMEQQGHDLIVERLDGTLFLVRCFEQAQVVNHEVSEEDNVHGLRVTIEMKNVTGWQELVEASSSSSD